MYCRKMSKTIFPQPNLHCKIDNKLISFWHNLDGNAHVDRLRDRLKILLDRVIPETLKNRSESILRVWARQCEFVVAHRLRRGQQMCSLYTKLWDERALKEFLNRFRQQMTRRSKELLLGAVGVSAFNWDDERISDNEMLLQMNEFDYIYDLKEKTIICKSCHKRQLVDVYVSDVAYCQCPNATSAQKNSHDEWLPFIERQDIVVWRRCHSSGSYEYKVYGKYDDVSAEDFLQVQIDTQYRKKWDATAISLEVLETDPQSESNSDVVYWELLWPRLFTNRDYVFNRRFIIDKNRKVMVIMSQGTTHPACPERPDKYRVQDYWSCMVIKPKTEFSEPGIEFGLTYYDNPGVNIPTAMTAWVAMRAMPDFLCRLRSASKEYKAYCASLAKEEFYLKNGFRTQDDLYNGLFSEDEINTDDTTEQKRTENRSPPQTPPPPSCATTSIKTPPHSESEVIMTSPSPIVAAETDNRSFWRYLHPYYYLR